MKQLFFKLSILIASIVCIAIIPAYSEPASNEVSVAEYARSKDGVEQLADLSVEQLINLEVTSAGKKVQRLHDVAAAIFVITEEDIRHSTATNIPELLRMVPGLHVARVNSSTWAIGSRGFTDVFSDKLLVLIDGRSVYTPLFSGVYWDLQDYVLEDIARIEVIRGPGASLWGANAVNGVINIITKNSKDTQGTLVSAGGGVQEQGFGEARYGTTLGDKSTVRAYTKYNKRDNFKSPSGGDSIDEWESVRSGFRMDSELTEKDLATVQGDFVYANEDSTAFVPSIAPPFGSTVENGLSTANANLLSRWNRKISEDSELQTHVYYDYMRRNEIYLDQKTSTLDFDLQHRFKPFERNEILWGAGYRYYHDDLVGHDNVYFTPVSRDVDLFSWFLQDEIAVVENKLHLIIGSKFEQNDFTDFEFQPTARVVYNPGENHTVWAAVSKAVRTPSRANEDVHFQAVSFADPTSGVPGVVEINGNRSQEIEDLIAYELGYRVQLSERASVDVATFYNDYKDLVSTSVGEPEIMFSPTPSFELPVTLVNGKNAEAIGGEVSLDYRATDWMRLTGWYSYLHINGSPSENATTAGLIPGQNEEKDSPVNQFSLRSLFTITPTVDFDASVRYVDSIPGRQVPSYTAVDLRVAWNFTKEFTFEVVGQNLLEDEHLEFSPIFVNTETAEVPRVVYAKLTWRH